MRAGKQLQERERDRQTDRQKTNERFFNFINGISTILFYIQPSGKKRQKATTTKTIENKIIVNSKQIIITIERERDRGGQTNKQTDTDRQTDRDRRERERMVVG